jgi:hypothetical protein
MMQFENLLGDGTRNTEKRPHFVETTANFVSKLIMFEQHKRIGLYSAQKNTIEVITYPHSPSINYLGFRHKS